MPNALKCQLSARYRPTDSYDLLYYSISLCFRFWAKWVLLCAQEHARIKDRVCGLPRTVMAAFGRWQMCQVGFMLPQIIKSHPSTFECNCDARLQLKSILASLLFHSRTEPWIETKMTNGRVNIVCCSEEAQVLVTRTRGPLAPSVSGLSCFSGRRTRWWNSLRPTRHSNCPVFCHGYGQPRPRRLTFCINLTRIESLSLKSFQWFFKHISNVT
jgi:hypothetical protein